MKICSGEIRESCSEGGGTDPETYAQGETYIEKIIGVLLKITQKCKLH